jgi:succinate dehydrogenase / fumarate reductase cytochrome b subunit
MIRRSVTYKRRILVSSQAAAKITAPKRPAGTLYRGREGMWSWVLHRITGVAIFFFLLVHVLDTALIRLDPEAYNAVIGTYKTPIMAIGEAALVAAIGLHALNGLRIILIDFTRIGPRIQRSMFWVVIGLWVILLAGFLPRHLMHAFGGE